ncbi:hypothetical protein ACFQ0M_47140 [Kitasatospora aburaviensis]
MGHVEWTTIAGLDEVPAAGEVIHADRLWQGPAGVARSRPSGWPNWPTAAPSSPPSATTTQGDARVPSWRAVVYGYWPRPAPVPRAPR